MPTYRRLLAPLAAGLVLAGLTAAPASAAHSWAGYHWARTANPFTLKLGDNVSDSWDAYLREASTDWNNSLVLQTTVEAGTAGTPKRCRATSGRVEVCNSTYGNNGWLGLAQVWTSSGHIIQGVAKMNDTYFNSPPYSQPEWRRLVMCQEVGHTFGLGHQDENQSNPNLGSCMDYTKDPAGTAATTGPLDNQHPNQHDYDQLATIYVHTDATTTVGASAPSPSAAGAGNSQAEWGRAVRYASDGRPILFERDLGNDQRVFTFVVWAG